MEAGGGGGGGLDALSGGTDISHLPARFLARKDRFGIDNANHPVESR